MSGDQFGQLGRAGQDVRMGLVTRLFGARGAGENTHDGAHAGVAARLQVEGRVADGNGFHDAVARPLPCLRQYERGGPPLRDIVAQVGDLLGTGWDSVMRTSRT